MKGSFTYKGFGHNYTVKIVKPLMLTLPREGSKPAQQIPLVNDEGTWVQVEVLGNVKEKGYRFPAVKEKLKR